ncbi:MAG: ATP-binding protein [Firmicutes bacterium]|nr:ATP-binding protein [Bacillota bacterium]
MIKPENIKKYILPLTLIIVLSIMMVMGIVYIRSYMNQKAAAERVAQLEQISSQIKVNLEYGLDNQWSLVDSIIHYCEGKKFDGKDDVRKEIGEIQKLFALDNYGCRLMFLDSQGTVYIDEGTAGIWDDINQLADGEKRHTFVTETSNVEGIYMSFVQKLDTPISDGEDGIDITHVALLKDITELRKYYITEAYGGHAATYIIKSNGVQAFYDAEDDIIGVRNVFKALSQAEDVKGMSFDEIMQILEERGIVSANIKIDETEYYYCLASLKQFDIYLMLMIPAEYVATNTIKMMNSFVRIQVVFILALIILLVIAFMSFVVIQKRNQMMQIEKHNNMELNRLRIEAENARAEAELANKAKTSFLNNMSHDIRTPMNAIIGFTNIALKQDNKPEVSKCLKNISSSSEHLLTLINDVLDISRIESGKIKFSPVPVEISSVAKSVTGIIEGFLSNRKLEFKTDLKTPEYPFVMADVVRLREVLVNILGNAVKFTEDGGKICFSTEYLPGQDEESIVVRYVISDTGVGMTQEFVEHIFDEFTQEDNGARTKYKGTGLGMTITKSYVDLMGGTISVKSTKGKGSEFTVEIPMKKTDETVNIIRGEEGNNVKLDGVHILLAEDNDLNAEIAVIQLEEAGIRVTRAFDGKDTVRTFSENSPGTFDVILMDIMMPDMSGYEATAAIRSMDNRPDGAEIPIIAMTANAFAEDVQASIDAGMDGHIAKPIDMNEVKKSISVNIDKDRKV